MCVGLGVEIQREPGRMENGRESERPPPLSFAHVLGPKSIPPPPSLRPILPPYSVRYSKFRGGESQKPGKKTARGEDRKHPTPLSNSPSLSLDGTPHRRSGWDGAGNSRDATPHTRKTTHSLLLPPFPFHLASSRASGRGRRPMGRR